MMTPATQVHSALPDTTLQCEYLNNQYSYAYTLTHLTYPHTVHLCTLSPPHLSPMHPLTPTPLAHTPLHTCSGEDHQRDDWLAIHKKICPIVTVLRSPLPHATSQEEREYRKHQQTLRKVGS